MKEYIGEILEVFMPEEYQNNNLINIMYRTKIGFKVNINDKIKEYVLDCNEDNARIMKSDKVIITEYLKDNIKHIYIEKYEEEEYE